MSFADAFAAFGLVYLLLVAWPLAKTDLREHRLPNRLVLPSFVFTLVGQFFASLIGGQWQQMGWALLGAALMFVAGLACNLWAGLGMGDVKLLSAIALALGWWGSGAVVVAILLGLGLAAAATGLLLLAKRTSLNQAIALGPYLLAGFAGSTIGLLYR